jgi:SH3 domain protein
LAGQNNQQLTKGSHGVKQIIFFISLFIMGFVQAEPLRYVSDQMEITLRSGKSSKNEILRLLPSGVALTVLENDKQAGYSRVRTSSGKEGWVLNRYLMNTPSARVRLATAEKKLAQIQDSLKEKNSIERERNQLNSQNVRLNKQLAKIRRVSSNAIKISEENETLRTSSIEMEHKLQMLEQENDSLQDRSYRNWFMTGAAVVIVSMLFGIILTRIRWRKKSSWGDL